MKKGNTSIFIIEEHHEAYFVWKYACEKGLINPAQNILLHIDEHSDMGVPYLNTSPFSLNGNMSNILNFVYRELGIATFITPAIYEGLFNKVYWIKQRHSKANRRGYKMYVRSQNSSGTILATGKVSVLDKFNDEIQSKSQDAKFYEFYKQHITDLSRLGNVLLDIDLDYFSCIQDPLKKSELRIEISKEEYHSFCQTPYHRIRFFEFGRVEAISEGSRYFYCLNRINDIRESPLKVSFETIVQRIEVVIDFLQKKIKTPLIITICRSRISGYTPNDQWEFIEGQLLKSLNNLYNVQSCSYISDL